MCRRLAAYRAEHGDAQVPKKFKPDPALGGWVAAVRRIGAGQVGPVEAALLESVGFEWVSVRQCGSAFMKSFRALRSFWEEHGHTDVEGVRGREDDLARWCAAQRLANSKGLLTAERVAYLDAIGFEWEASAL
jgi:hypothetical protein